MKAVILGLAALSLFMTTNLSAEYKDSVDENGCWDALVPFVEGSGSCLVKVSTSWHKTQLRVKWKNRCAYRIYFQYCNERTSGSWDCGATGISAGNTRTASTYNATGHHTAIAIGSEKGRYDMVCNDSVEGWHDIDTNYVSSAESSEAPPGRGQGKGSWVQFFLRGMGMNNGGIDQGNPGSVIDVTVDGRYKTKSTPLASTSFAGPPRAICDKSKALQLSPGNHSYYHGKKGGKFDLAKGECKAIEISTQNI